MRRLIHGFLFLLLLSLHLTGCGGGGNMTLGTQEPVVLSETLRAPEDLPSSGPMAPPTMVPAMVTATPQVSFPHPIPAEGKGNLVGQVRWNNVGVAGIDLKICTEFAWFGGCKGTVYTARSDQDGIFLFPGITPGDYVLTLRLFNSDEWVYITTGLMTERNYHVRAGETTEVGVNDIFKKDLQSISPVEKAMVSDLRPPLSWEAYPDATTYKLWLNPEKGDSIAPFEKLDTNLYIPNVDLFNCEYTWKVEAYNSNGIQIAEFNDYQHFTITGAAYGCTIKVLHPLSNTVVPSSGIELEWEAHPLAETYKLFVWPEEDASIHILDFVEVQGTTYSITDTLKPGKYVLSIYAYDTKGKGIAASDISYFIVK